MRRLIPGNPFRVLDHSLSLMKCFLQASRGRCIKTALLSPPTARKPPSDWGVTVTREGIQPRLATCVRACVHAYVRQPPLASCVCACVHACSCVVGVIAHVKPEGLLRYRSWECHLPPLETRSLIGLQLTDRYTGWRILISPTPHPLPSHPHLNAGITSSCDHAWQFSLVV